MRTFLIAAGSILSLTLLLFLALCGVSIVDILLGAVAYAQDVAAPAVNEAGKVAVPWGDWLGLSLANLRDLIVSGFVTVVGVLLAKFLPAAKNILTTAQVEQLINRAVDFAIAAVEGATAGKVANVAIANEVLEKALEYAVDAAPTLASKISDTLRPKIIARIGAAGIVPAEATVGPIIVPDQAPAVASLMSTPTSGSTVVGFVEPYKMAA